MIYNDLYVLYDVIWCICVLTIYETWWVSPFHHYHRHGRNLLRCFSLWLTTCRCVCDRRLAEVQRLLPSDPGKHIAQYIGHGHSHRGHTWLAQDHVDTSSVSLHHVTCRYTRMWLLQTKFVGCVLHPQCLFKLLTHPMTMTHLRVSWLDNMFAKGRIWILDHWVAKNTLVVWVIYSYRWPPKFTKSTLSIMS